MKYVTYFITVVLLTMLFCILFWLFSPSYYKNVSYVSPLPPYLDRKHNDQVTFLDLWLPFLLGEDSEDNKAPTLSAQSALMYDISTDTMLYEKAVKTKLPMASVTKIMTAIVALEYKKSDDKYFVEQEHLVGENSMGLLVGEVLSLEELLYGLLLPSGNDAAEVLAGNYTGGRSVFIQAMNDKAKALGLTDTHFTNPSGLQGDGEQYTTAYDLLVIARYGLDNLPTFSKVVATYEHSIPATQTHQAYVLLNDTNLISSYPGVKGVKTGYTPEAGLCIVTYLEYRGHKLIGVLLKSENRRQEMKDLLDYSLRSLQITPPKHE